MVSNEGFFSFSGTIHIWLYPQNASMKVKSYGPLLHLLASQFKELGSHPLDILYYSS